MARFYIRQIVFSLGSGSFASARWRSECCSGDRGVFPWPKSGLNNRILDKRLILWLLSGLAVQGVRGESLTALMRSVALSA